MRFEVSKVHMYLEFDISRSLKVKSNGAIGLPINNFLLVSRGNIIGLTQLLYKI